ncbi:LysR family transcriptional regulator [Micromonospora sp. 067-2]|uniref:LysR family transcriptional regulator n=1 Tax=Micromonospora sp. 067-2 TaxID=2789270 RepID=UPI00397A8FF0
MQQCPTTKIRHAFHDWSAWHISNVAELTLTGLRVIQQVAATGSFTRAAEALGYTQSAISRQAVSRSEPSPQQPWR